MLNGIRSGDLGGQQLYSALAILYLLHLKRNFPFLIIGALLLADAQLILSPKT